MVILRASYLKQNMGVMLIFFFKVNVNLRQLLWFVVPLAVNGEFWRILANIGDFEGFAFGASYPFT